MTYHGNSNKTTDYKNGTHITRSNEVPVEVPKIVEVPKTKSITVTQCDTTKTPYNDHPSENYGIVNGLYDKPCFSQPYAEFVKINSQRVEQDLQRINASSCTNMVNEELNRMYQSEYIGKLFTNMLRETSILIIDYINNYEITDKYLPQQLLCTDFLLMKLRSRICSLKRLNGNSSIEKYIITDNFNPLWDINKLTQIYDGESIRLATNTKNNKPVVVCVRDDVNTDILTFCKEISDKFINIIHTGMGSISMVNSMKVSRTNFNITFYNVFVSCFMHANTKKNQQNYRNKQQNYRNSINKNIVEKYKRSDFYICACYLPNNGSDEIEQLKRHILLNVYYG